MGISGADEDTSDKLARAEISWRRMRMNLEHRKNLGEGWNLLKPAHLKREGKYDHKSTGCYSIWCDGLLILDILLLCCRWEWTFEMTCRIRGRTERLEPDRFLTPYKLTCQWPVWIFCPFFDKGCGCRNRPQWKNHKRRSINSPSIQHSRSSFPSAHFPV